MESGFDHRSVHAGRIGGALGVLSALLLYSAVRWVHDWGAASVALVAAWTLATVAALVVTSFALRGSGGSRRMASLGLWLALLSVIALAFAGIAAATGLAETPMDCGGG